jgi:hypothetical protein
MKLLGLGARCTKKCLNSSSQGRNIKGHKIQGFDQALEMVKFWLNPFALLGRRL